MNASRFWTVVGGRKMFNGYLAFVTLTIASFWLHPTFVEYSVGILACLGITGGLVAYEDRKSARPKGVRRASDGANVPHQWADGDPHEGVI